MKVLVTGGYGFIGSHIVERFFKEGHDICIIDDLSTGYKSNVTCKHSFYNVNSDDNKCEEIFLAKRFDLVIHCASNDNNEDAIKNRSDQSRDICGLINILSLAKEHGIKHVIFLSSTDVYGCSSQISIPEDQLANPKSSFAFSKYTEEQYLMAWSSHFERNALCLRLSSVYGPKQRDNGTFNIVTSIMNKNATEKIEVDERNGYDMIFVDDVVDAIYRAAMCELTGIYNLSSNIYYTNTQIVEKIAKLRKSRIDKHIHDKKANRLNCSYDNSRIKEALDWTPIYTLEDGLKRTLEWFSKEQNVLLTYPRKSNKRFRIVVKSLLPFTENCILFVLLLVSSTYIKSTYTGDFMVLLLIYVLLMGIMHGSRQSIISIILALFLFFYSKVSIGENIMTILYDPVELLNFSTLIFIGVFTGFSVDKMQQKAIQNQEKITLLNERYKFLQEINKENIMIKDTLQEQIINSQESFGKVSSIIIGLDSFEPERILFSAVKVIESVMKNNHVAIYSLTQNKTFLRLIASSENSSFKYPRSQKIMANDQYDQLVKTGAIFVNNEFNSKVPFFIAAIKNEDIVIGLIMLYQPDFDLITLHYKNLFEIVAGLISLELSRAIQYSKLANDDSYIEGTMIIKQSYFKKLAISKINIYQEFGIPYTILKADINMNMLNESIVSLLANVRDSDIFGLIDKSIYILLSNVNKMESDKIIERLSHQGYKITTESGIKDD
jgi:UDP-glucuronate decarboxylase